MKRITVTLTEDQIRKMLELANKDLTNTGTGFSQEKFEQHAFTIRLIDKLQAELVR